MRKVACILALATAGANLSATAVPAAAQDVTSVTVSIADLNLNAAAGRETLQRRLKFATRRVCGVPDSRSPAHHSEVSACRADAFARANAQVTIAMGSSGNIRVAR